MKFKRTNVCGEPRSEMSQIGQHVQTCEDRKCVQRRKETQAECAGHRDDLVKEDKAPFLLPYPPLKYPTWPGKIRTVSKVMAMARPCGSPWLPGSPRDHLVLTGWDNLLKGGA